MLSYIKEMTSKINEKNERKYICEKCHYVCCYLSDYDRHLSTGKHKRLTNASKMLPENEKLNMTASVVRVINTDRVILSTKKVANLLRRKKKRQMKKQ